MDEGVFEEQKDKAAVLFRHNPGYRRAFLVILDACESEAVPLSQLEELVAAVPGYGKLRQPPFFPIEWLSQAGCLEERYIDHEGRLHGACDVEGLTEDEFDDLVAESAFLLTDVGRATKEAFDPRQKLAELLGDEPDRADLYRDLLEFLEEKRTFAQIEAMLRGRAELTTADGARLQPSLFVDKLDAAGVIAYDGGWQVSSEGKELLAV